MRGRGQPGEQVAPELLWRLALLARVRRAALAPLVTRLQSCGRLHGPDRRRVYAPAGVLPATRKFVAAPSVVRFAHIARLHRRQRLARQRRRWSQSVARRASAAAPRAVGWRIVVRPALAADLFAPRLSTATLGPTLQRTLLLREDLYRRARVQRGGRCGQGATCLASQQRRASCAPGLNLQRPPRRRVFPRATRALAPPAPRLRPQRGRGGRSSHQWRRRGARRAQRHCECHCERREQKRQCRLALVAASCSLWESVGWQWRRVR